MIRQIVQISKNTFTDRQRNGFLLLIGVVLSATFIGLLSVYVGQAILSDMRRQGESRAGFYSQSLKSNLEKFRHLPYVLSRDDRIRQLLLYRIPALRVNPHLEDFGHATGSLIFVMDDGGNALATSNWRTDQSLMGHNFSFRPYYIVARDGEPGGYFAFGLRTKKPGYFLSYPVFHTGKLLGVVAVKVDLLPLQESWLKGGETIIVSDGHGVVILSSRKDWRYQALKPLVEKTKNRLRRTQFLELPLDSLSLQRKAGIRDTVLTIDGEKFLEISRQLPKYGWRLHYLLDYGRINRAMWGSLVASLSFFIIMFLLLLYIRERRQKMVSRRQAEEAEKDSLSERIAAAGGRGTQNDGSNVAADPENWYRLANLPRLVVCQLLLHMN